MKTRSYVLKVYAVMVRARRCEKYPFMYWIIIRFFMYMYTGLRRQFAVCTQHVFAHSFSHRNGNGKLVTSQTLERYHRSQVGQQNDFAAFDISETVSKVYSSYPVQGSIICLNRFSNFSNFFVFKIQLFPVMCQCSEYDFDRANKLIPNFTLCTSDDN